MVAAGSPATPPTEVTDFTIDTPGAAVTVVLAVDDAVDVWLSVTVAVLVTEPVPPQPSISAWVTVCDAV